MNKYYKIRCLYLFLQVLLTRSAQAGCAVESFKFGMSHKALVRKLKLDDYLYNPLQENSNSNSEIFRRLLITPGENVLGMINLLKVSQLSFYF
jgi:hypothetical protein